MPDKLKARRHLLQKISSQRPPSRWSFYSGFVLASICYLDEAGCPGPLPSTNSDIQPLFAIGGLILDVEHIQPLTTEFVELKRKFFPAKFSHISHDLDALTIEIKGSELRKSMRRGRWPF